MAGSVAGAIAGKVAGKVLGGGKKDGGSQGPSFVPFKAGGLSATLDGAGKIVVDRGFGRQDTITAIRDNYLNSAADIRGFIPKFNTTFDTRANELTGLMEQVKPGFGALTSARVNAVHNARDKAISNLADDYGRRGILGSNLAQDNIAAIRSDFANQEAEVRAASFLEELDVTTQLMQERFQTDIGKFQTEMDNLLMASQFERSSDQFEYDALNVELNAGLASMGASISALSSLNEIEAKLAAQNAIGQGNMAALFADKATPFFDDLFTGFGNGGLSNDAINLASGGGLFNL